jgi:hypothetical protein
MASNKPKSVRQRVSRTDFDVSRLPGPFYVSGSIGNRRDRLAGVHEPVWFDTATKQFVLADGRLAFDAEPSKTPPQVLSARAQERAVKQEKLKDAQGSLNNAQRALEDALKAGNLAAADVLKVEAQAARKKREKAKEALAPFLTSTDKISVIADESRKLPKGRASELAVLSEYNAKDGAVRFFFPGVGDDVKGVDPDQKCRDSACLLIAPAVRSALSRFTDADAENRGEHGYFSVSKWDFPKAIKLL